MQAIEFQFSFTNLFILNFSISSTSFGGLDQFISINQIINNHEKIIFSSFLV